MPLLLRIPLLFLSSPLLLGFLSIQRYQTQNSPLHRSPHGAITFLNPQLISPAYTHYPLISSLNKYVLITSHVPALLEVLGTLWRTWLRPHRTRGPGTDRPRPCIQHILYSVLGCCIIRSHTLLSPCPDSKLHIGKTSFFHLFMYPPSLICFNKHPGNTRDVQDTSKTNT